MGKNADNDALEPVRVGQFVVGRVDEVNGEGAEEVPFMPTRHELEELVRYWVGRMLLADLRYFETAVTGSTESRLAEFASKRISRAAGILGEETVRRICADVESTVRDRSGLAPDDWALFLRRDEEEWEAYWSRPTFWRNTDT